MELETEQKTIIGKAYASRKKKDKRPESDFYSTPISLVWELLKTDELKGCQKILEPCCGEYAISEELEKAGFTVISNDIKYGQNIFESEYKNQFDAVVTNPPFSQFTDVINACRKFAPKTIAIGKTNFLGVHARNKSDFWNGLKAIYIFDRQVDYQTPYRKDGLFCVGCLVTGWFVWENGYKGKPEINFIDVQKYAALGSYDRYKKLNGCVENGRRTKRIVE